MLLDVVVFVLFKFFVKGLLLVLVNGRSISIWIHMLHVGKPHISELLHHLGSVLLTLFQALIRVLFNGVSVVDAVFIRVLEHINFGLAVLLYEIRPEELLGGLHTPNFNWFFNFKWLLLIQVIIQLAIRLLLSLPIILLIFQPDFLLVCLSLFRSL